MNDLEYLAQIEQQYRRNVLYPALERKERLVRELHRIERAERGPARRHPAQWLGDRLVNLGDRLVSAGRRLSPPRRETPLRPG